MARRSQIARFRTATGGRARPARAAEPSFKRNGSAVAARTSVRNARRRLPKCQVPELPEVETSARGLRPRLVDRRVVSVGGVDWPRMLPNTTEAELQEELVGRQVTSIGRKGKYLLIELDGDTWLVIHRKMSGNLLLATAEAPPVKHTHLEVIFDDETVLRFVDP